MQDEINRPQTESRGRKALPVAQPVRSAARTPEGRQRGSRVPHRTTAATPSEAPTPGRSEPRGVQIDVRLAFTLFGFSVAAVLIILFGLDLVMAVPFQRISMMMDVTYLICGIILAGLSWSCLRDLR